MISVFYRPRYCIHLAVSSIIMKLPYYIGTRCTREDISFICATEGKTDDSGCGLLNYITYSNK